MKIYAFAFSLHNISTKTLYNLYNIDHRYLVFKNNIDKYIEIIKNENPDYILGLGIYSKQSKYLHLETKCSNLFRKGYINNEVSLIEETITPFLEESNDMKYTQTIGNYLCNLISYRIMSLITDGEINSQYTFIHIPKKFNGNVQEIINDSIKNKLTSSYSQQTNQQKF